MPKIRREKLPEPLLRHLALRVRQRHITPQHLGELSTWLATNPTVPPGAWFKRFAAFTICGDGELIKTLLESGQHPFGTEVF
jgi:hypothetical protein